MKKFKSKALIFSAVCTGMLLCGGTAYGETVDVSELTADKTITEDSVITGTNEAFNHTITISGDITVKLQNVSITSQSAGTASPITCADTTNGAKLLISEGTNTVKAIETSEMLQTGKGMAAINIPMGETLIIEADEQYPNATLYATGAVGIGGSHSIGSSDNYTSMGNLTINSGNITAKGDIDGSATYGLGPGIGAGSYCNMGNITINGGNITATGGQYAPGIGCRSATDGTKPQITINGGIINATGGNGAAGIGSGVKPNSLAYGENESNFHDIIINGGNITATGTNNATGIGGGYCQSGNITINGGTVTATGGSGAKNQAGIGAGHVKKTLFSGDLYGKCDCVCINGGSVKAVSTDSFSYGAIFTGVNGDGATNDAGDKVYECKVDAPNAAAVTVDDVKLKIDGIHTDDSILYIYLPEQKTVSAIRAFDGNKSIVANKRVQYSTEEAAITEVTPQVSIGGVMVDPNDKNALIAVMSASDDELTGYEKVGFICSSERGSLSGTEITQNTIYKRIIIDGMELTAEGAGADLQGDSSKASYVFTAYPEGMSGTVYVTPFIKTNDGAYIYGTTGCCDL